MNLIKNQQSVLLAALMVLLLAGWFAPASSAFFEIDFWLLWLVAMTFLALPMIYLEVALAKRSQKTPVAGLEELTRQADAATYWRVSSWLGVVLITLLSVGLLDFASTTVAQQLQLTAMNQDMYVLVGLLVLAVALSFAGEWLLLVGTVLAVAATVISGFHAAEWRMTGTSLLEWKNAVTLALISTGLGLGLYWQASLTKTAQKRKTTWTVLPIWLAQVIAGIAFVLFQGVQGEVANMLYAAAAVAAVAMLVRYLRQNLITKPNGIFIGIALLAGALSLWSLPNSTKLMVALVSLLGLVISFLYAVFAGWQMKISHLRKAIKFNSEVTYNLWRVAVRLVVPMSVLLALVGLAMTLPKLFG